MAASLRLALQQYGGNITTGPVIEDGKTVTALNGAITAGQDGLESCLAAEDQWQRGLSRLGDMADGPKLADIAIWQSSVEDAVTECVLTDSPTPNALSAGSDVDDVAEILHTSSFSTVMDQLKQHADLVVIDSPSPFTATDALSIAAQADDVVVLVRRASSSTLPVLACSVVSSTVRTRSGSIAMAAGRRW